MIKNLIDFIKAQPISNNKEHPKVAVTCNNLLLKCYSTTDLFIYSELIRAIGGNPEYKILKHNNVSYSVINSNSEYVIDLLRNNPDNINTEIDENSNTNTVDEEVDIETRVNEVIKKHQNKNKEK